MAGQHKRVLLSVRPRFADRIFAGSKTVELRRRTPSIQPGDTLLFYVTSPRKALCGQAVVRGVNTGVPGELWPAIRGCSGVSEEEYWEYYDGANTACAILFGAVEEFAQPVPLDELRRLLGGFVAPRDYRYWSADDVARLGTRLVWRRIAPAPRVRRVMAHAEQ